MNLKASLLRVETAVVVYTAVQARDLLMAWRHSPFDRLGALVFLLWLVPAVRAAWKRTAPAPLTWLVWVALGFALAGGISGINSLNNIALALVLAGRWPLPGNRLWYWVALGLTWMPIFGWFGAKAGMPVWLVETARGLLGLLSLAV